jgi:hypothetical protein
MSGIPAYDAGDPVRLIGTFVNSGGTMTTPGAVTLSIIPPAQWGAVVPGTTSYTLAQGSVQIAAAGSVYYDMLPLPSGTPGVWQYSFVGSGPYAAFTDQFFVRQGVR